MAPADSLSPPSTRIAFRGRVSKFMGRHSLKTGMRLPRSSTIPGYQHRDAGRVSPSRQAFTSASATSTVAGTGASLASMLLGFPSAGSVTTSLPLENHVHYYGFLRPGRFPRQQEADPQLRRSLRIRDRTAVVAQQPDCRIQPEQRSIRFRAQVTGITTNGVIEYAGPERITAQATHPNSDKFSPRVGFAWNALNSKTTHPRRLRAALGAVHFSLVYADRLYQFALLTSRRTTAT